jgi:hypothetical protein
VERQVRGLQLRGADLPPTKWSGGSTCVPVCVLMDTTERFETSPRRMADVRSIETTGSPGY